MKMWWLYDLDDYEYQLSDPLLLLPITTAAVATKIISLDIVFFHTVGTDTLSRWNSCITKGTCRCYRVAIGGGC